MALVLVITCSGKLASNVVILTTRYMYILDRGLINYPLSGYMFGCVFSIPSVCLTSSQLSVDNIISTFTYNMQQISQNCIYFNRQCNQRRAMSFFIFVFLLSILSWTVLTTKCLECYASRNRILGSSTSHQFRSFFLHSGEISNIS